MPRPMMIMSYDQVPVGPEIVRFVDNFDTSQDVKVELLSYVRSDSVFEPLSREEVLGEWGEITLIEFPSGAWPRELALGLLGRLLVVRNDLIRGQGSTIIAKYGHQAMDKVEDLRAEWLADTAVQKATNSLIELLERAAHGFNVQMVAVWVQRVQSSLLEKMTLCQGQPLQELQRDLALVGDCGYRNGKHVIAACVAEAHETLHGALRQDTLLYEFLYITNEEVLALRNDRLGIASKKPKTEPDEAVSTAAKPPEGGLNLDSFKLSPSGIYVPA